MSNNPLNDFINAIRTDVINSMQAKGRFATGETISNLLIVDEIDGDIPLSSALYGPLYIGALEFGRGPTSPDAVLGSPPMIERIQAWCAAKGIDQKYSWAIKKNIDKVGYPGKPGVLTEPLSDDNINLRLNEVLDDLANITLTEVNNNLQLVA